MTTRPLPSSQIIHRTKYRIPRSRFLAGLTKKLYNSSFVTGFAPNPTSTIDDFIQTVHYAVAARTPSSTEFDYWNNILRRACSAGSDSRLSSAVDFGHTLFESAEYGARQRNDHWYVYDLYKSYLQRDPDANGWAYWESVVPTQGRENVRRAFEESGEFATIVGGLTPNGTPGAQRNLWADRIEPVNRTGDSGVDPFSRNLNWSLSLVSLPGRAGLDLGLALSYNSLIYTPSFPYIYFDEDNGSPVPGFRIGFPTIQRRFFNADTGQDAYLLITSSGAKVELRQIGSSTVYEAADSSNLQLLDGGSYLTLIASDGTQMTFAKVNNEWRCTQIKDRNGNFISVTYEWWGQIDTVTDTLGRQIKFNYDANLNPTSISQTWTVNGQPQTHTWVSFFYGSQTLSTGYSNNGQSAPVLVGAKNGDFMLTLYQVSVDSGSTYTFDYNSYMQVSKITRSSYAGTHQYTAYNFDVSGFDSPRVNAEREWAQGWNGSNGVPSEVVTNYSHSGNLCTITLPDASQIKEYYGTDGTYQRGLVTLSEVWSGGVKQKWTTTTWTQDNTGATYLTNPRVTETNVYDSAGNRRRTTIDYFSFTPPTGGVITLPSDVKEYQANASSVYRRTHTDYLSFLWDFTSRRLIAVPYSISIYDGNDVLQSKTSYWYDSDSQYLVNTSATPTQHDASYNTSFLLGRGNLTQVMQFDVSDPNNEAKGHARQFGYDINGSLVFARDGSNGNAANGNQTNFVYSDAFSDGVNRNTFAYPTTTNDPDGYSFTTKYSFDFGAITYKRSPQPNTTANTPGPEQTITYDSARRPDRITTVTNGAYIRYEYSPTYVESYATVNNVGDEAYTFQQFDGAGRVTATAGNHPGSSGGYRGQKFLYDQMGRLTAQSNPTEHNGSAGSWTAVGDDSVWLYSTQTYDWKGRPLVTTNPDGTTHEASYSGCGCAGGEVVTLTDEGTVVDTATKKRQQKIYSDVLGRTVKKEILNWDGSGQYGTGGTVYAATVTTYNEGDQVTQVRQYAGPEGSAYQDTTLSYDGYGLLRTRHVPEQNAGTATTWEYNADNTILEITDARGAAVTFTYNGRHQVTGIIYSAPVGITVPGAVTFTYDAAGNRISMTDGSGNTTYQYNPLSQLTSETRAFSGLAGNYALSYDYNLAGELKSITDPTGAAITYGFDSGGRVDSVNGSAFGGVTSYESNIRYRAWGEIKSLSYGNSRTLSTSFDTRLRPTHFEIPGVISKDYQYHSDSRIKYAADLLDNRFDRSYDFDHAGRPSEALSGPAARGLADTGDRPYRQFYQYDALSNLVARPGSRLWTGPGGAFGSDGYINNRNIDWAYDADGRLSDSGDQQYTYDAGGRARTVVSNDATRTQTRTYDGDGSATKLVEVQDAVTTTGYFVVSTVLNAVVTELNQSGQKTRTFVYAGGRVLAWQQKNGSLETVIWEHQDPGNTSYRMTKTTGAMDLTRSAELDPLGSDAGVKDPYVFPSQWPEEDLTYPGFAELQDGDCAIDGIAAPCSLVNQLLRSGAAQLSPGSSSAAALNIGAQPIYGKFCVCVGDDCECHYDITDYTNSWAASSLSPQNSGGQTDPCANVKASDLNYNKVRPRGKDSNGQPINENGLDHITRRHIMLDDPKQGFLTQSKLPIAAQSASKFVYQDNVKSVKEAQGYVIEANKVVFQAGKSNYSWSGGHIVMTFVFPVVPRMSGGVFAGIGFDVKRGFGLPTNAMTLVLEDNCIDVITAYPGKP